MSESRRGIRAGAALALILLVGPLLAACAGIPRDGAVITGAEVSQQDGSAIEYVVEGPGDGDSVQEILAGFIDAFRSLGDYDVARQFLSSEFVNEWEPRESVLVYSGQDRLVPVSDTAMDYVITANAAVDATGSYTSFPPAPSTLRYEFVQEGGEWRINSAPNGIVLSAVEFENVFSEHVLYFIDTGGSALVPDLRWFPDGTAATRVVSALLAGPPPWLQGAVTTAFPAGTQLQSPKRVAVDDQIARVDLTAEALAASASQRQLMRLQLETSLGQVPSITTTVISVNDSVLDIAEPGAGLPQPRIQVDNRPLVLQDGQFGYFANGQISSIEGISDDVAALAPSAAVLGRGGSVAAVLNAEGVWVVRRSAEPALLDARPGLIAPGLDNYGYVWTVPAGAPGSLQAHSFDGTHHSVGTSLPADARVAALEVSRDGARVAVLLATPTGPRLLVSAIIRDANAGNVPTRLGESVIDSSLDTGLALDLAWLDETTVATLTSSGAGADTTVAEHQVGGTRTVNVGPAGGTEIVGGNGQAGIRVLGADGLVVARRPSGWQTTQVEAQFLATQR